MTVDGVRVATADDARPIAHLSEQLGYPCDPRDIRSRLTQGATDGSRAVFVAVRDRAVVGWIEVGIRSSLESGSWAEILGLIVDESARRGGVGGSLVETARRWAIERGQSRLRVRTNVRREDAAAFYANQGFHEKKEQRVFDLVLPEED